MKKKNVIIFLVTLFSIFKITAQQPSHFKLGEDDFSGINIYSLLQDNQQNYWIATNNGLYKYDGYNFTKLYCENVLSNSMFQMTMDYTGNVYCHNLSGQIFQVKDDTCRLYFQIPDSLMRNEFSFEFDNTNTLTIASTNIFQVDEQKNINPIYSKPIGHSAGLFRTKDNNLLAFNVYNNEQIKIRNNSYTSEYHNLKQGVFPKYIYYKNRLFVYDQKEGKSIPNLLDSNGLKLQLPVLKNQKSKSLIYTDNNNLWVASLSGGVQYYGDEYSENTLFKSKIISAFLKDKENNIILGTFGEGLIVIPNIEIKDLDIDHLNIKVTKITSDQNDNIYFGGRDGRVYKLDTINNITKIKEKGFQQIEILEHVNNGLLINYMNVKLVGLDDYKTIKIFAGSIKDIVPTFNNEYILASNSGIYWYNPLLQNNLAIQNNSSFFSLTKFNERSGCVGYDTINNIVYSGSVSGLKIGNESKTRFFTLNGKPVVARDILFHNQKIFIATKNNGVLIFNNGELVNQWNTSNNLFSNTTKQIKVYEGNFYLSTESGLHILTNNGEIINNITKSDGLNVNSIVDFEIVDNVIWIVNKKGIQKIDLSKIKSDSFTPTIELSKIIVNDHRIDENKFTYNHNENKFIFHLNSRSLKYKNDINYHHQLEGIDKKWVLNNYDNHIIEYKSLPPNKYTFKVKAVYKSKESETLYYSFIIEKPYWERWWFYIGIIISFLIITFVIFRFQIKRQRKKTRLQNQLSLTQLTALKSQMNPHFIFNSLNSIQDLILQQDRENAYNYISKFALLVRKILHHSDKDFIEIEDEIKILTVYLELEELRFKKDFSFTIEANNITDIEIPPMLIQPFVENALKHGLLHKKGNKLLSIVFNLTDDILTCEITDNGIGRQKSNEIKQRQNKTHDSFSVKSITNRFDILKDLYGEDIGVSFDDLFADNEAVGTKVILKIPFKRRF